MFRKVMIRSYYDGLIFDPTKTPEEREKAVEKAERLSRELTEWPNPDKKTQ